MKQLFLTLILFLIAGIPANARKTQTTVIEGTVVDRPYSKTLLLSKADVDMRVTPPREIPILDGHFLYSFEAEPEAYELIFADEWQRGSWRHTIFFPGDGTNDTIRIILYPSDSASMNQVTGGSHNREHQYMDSIFTCDTPFFRALDSLQETRSKNNTYLNTTASALLDQIKNEQNRSVKDSLWGVWYAMQDSRQHMSPEASATDRQMRVYFDSVQNARYEYIRRHPSLAGYFWLYQQQMFGSRSPESRPLREEIYRTVYTPQFPEHPYTARLDTLFYRQISIGKPFADFEAPDLDGRMHRLREAVRGKMAVIDLWASWCGPCRRHSTALIPIYNEFKDKGFTVVGVARESDNADAMRKAIAKDGYPWVNLLELNDRAGIWKLYGRHNAAGGQFLIDKEGTILVVDPTAAELRQILSEKLR